MVNETWKDLPKLEIEQGSDATAQQKALFVPPKPISNSMICNRKLQAHGKSLAL